MPFNENKRAEYGDTTGVPPQGRARGVRIRPWREHGDRGARFTKVGEGGALASFNPTNGPLDRVRVDSGGQVLTTNQGVPVATTRTR